MKWLKTQFLLGLSLVILSAILYFLHFLIFKNMYHIFIYLLSDLAFLPIEVLLVMVIIEKLLGEREKRFMLNKMNMVIGAFFSEVGGELLKRLFKFDKEIDNLRAKLIVSANWTHHDFNSVRRDLRKYEINVESRKGDLDDLRSFLIVKRDFLLRLLENPNILEHESFTELLWAVFHLTEELTNRKNVKSLPDSDLEHISNDIKRAYITLISEWLEYMEHLKYQYPFLFSYAVRTNPFDLDAKVEVG
ncbi:MAG: hypothetical protein ACUVWP_07375 [bacterium]